MQRAGAEEAAGSQAAAGGAGRSGAGLAAAPAGRLLKRELRLLESIFHRGHERFRIGSACPDEISCEFVPGAGARAGGSASRGPPPGPVRIHCNITVRAGGRRGGRLTGPGWAACRVWGDTGRRSVVGPRPFAGPAGSALRRIGVPGPRPPELRSTERGDGPLATLPRSVGAHRHRVAAAGRGRGFSSTKAGLWPREWDVCGTSRRGWAPGSFIIHSRSFPRVVGLRFQHRESGALRSSTQCWRW